MSVSAAAPAEPPPAAPTRASDAFARTATRITIARSVQFAGLFALAALMTRLMPKRDYGTFLHVTTLAPIVANVVAIPAAKAITFHVARTARPDLFLRRAATGLLGVSAAIGAVAAFVPGALAALDPSDGALASRSVLIGAIFALAIPFSVAETLMIVRGAAHLVPRLLVAQAVWLAAWVGGAAILSPEGRTLDWTLHALAGAYAMQAMVGVWWLLRPFPAEQRGGEWPVGVASFTLPVFFGVLLNLAAAQFDKFLVPLLPSSGIDESVKATYMRGAMEIPLLGAIAMSFQGLAAPRLAALHAAGDREEMLRTWRHVCRTVALATVPATALAIALAPDLMEAAFGAKYRASAAVFVWYAGLLISRVFLPMLLLESAGATGRGFLCSVSQAVFALCAAVLLVPALGPPGAAAAMLAGQFLGNWLVGGALAARVLGVRPASLLDWGHFGCLSAASAGAALAAAVVAALPGPAGLSVWLRIPLSGLAFLAAFAVLAPLLRAVARDDLRALRRLLSRGR